MSRQFERLGGVLGAIAAEGEPQTRREVPYAINELTHAVDRLEKSISALYERTCCVQGPTDAAEVKNAEGPKHSTQIGGELFSLIKRIHDMSNSLESLESRIQL